MNIPQYPFSIFIGLCNLFVREWMKKDSANKGEGERKWKIWAGDGDGEGSTYGAGKVAKKITQEVGVGKFIYKSENPSYSIRKLEYPFCIIWLDQKRIKHLLICGAG